jgi:hypothetical protein
MRPQHLTDVIEVEMPVDASQQVIGRDMVIEAEIVKYVRNWQARSNSSSALWLVISARAASKPSWEAGQNPQRVRWMVQRPWADARKNVALGFTA